MGEIEVAGKDAVAAVQRISCNDAGSLEVGQAQYSGLLSDSGTFLDDVIVYRMGPGHFLIRRQRIQHRERLRVDQRADFRGR